MKKDMDEIQFLIQKVDRIFEHDASGHDRWHTLRVYETAMRIAERENCDQRIVAISALLHDVDDMKLFSTEEYANARAIMAEMNHDKETTDAVLTIISQISYKGTDSVVPTSIEGKIVQDADRLDALGAIGIARAFAYGGSRGRCMYDPTVKPLEHITEEAYRNNAGTTINHFHEKLFLLKDLMNTDTGREIALERDQYMHAFIDKFMAEWNGEDSADHNFWGTSEMKNISENASRIGRIRDQEKLSHIKVYTSETLYEGDSWLKKPIKTVLDLLPVFEGNENLYVLDLGCGVGRNCIPIAQKYRHIDCKIDCVDILDLAIIQLAENCAKYDVSSCVNGIVSPLEEYDIPVEKYHWILAVSALEHVESEACFRDMLKKIRNGIRKGGIVSLVINTDISEVEKDTGTERDVQFEVNMKTEDLLKLLNEIFAGWEVQKSKTVWQEYDIPRDKMIHLSTCVVTWCARKIL